MSQERKYDRIIGLAHLLLPLALGLLTGALSLIPDSAHAVGLVIQQTAAGQLIAGFVYQRIVTQVLLAFWGVAAGAVFYYGARLVLDSYKDQALSEVNTAFINLLIGFAIIACSAALASAFSTSGLSSDAVADIQPDLVASSLDSVRRFIIAFSAAIFVLIVTIAALQMITSRGEEGEFDKWRKVLVGAVTGVVIMFLADAIVLAVAERDALLILEELRGIAMFLLTIIGFLCAVAIIVAGVLLIVSIDESLRDRAKTTIISTLIALAVVMASYAIIATFVPISSNIP